VKEGVRRSALFRLRLASVEIARTNVVAVERAADLNQLPVGFSGNCRRYTRDRFMPMPHCWRKIAMRSWTSRKNVLSIVIDS